MNVPAAQIDPHRVVLELDLDKIFQSTYLKPVLDRLVAGAVKGKGDPGCSCKCGSDSGSGSGSG